jgi:hypothetical protein
MRRDGWDEERIRAVRDAYRALYHDRGRLSLSEAVAQLAVTLPNEGPERNPVVRLTSWLTEHLGTSVRGRVQEAFREPPIGLRPNPSAGGGAANGDGAPANGDGAPANGDAQAQGNVHGSTFAGGKGGGEAAGSGVPLA